MKGERGGVRIGSSRGLGYLVFHYSGWQHTSEMLEGQAKKNGNEEKKRERRRRGRGEAYTLLSRVPPAWQPHAGCPEWGDERTRGTQPAGQPHTPLSLQGRYQTLPFSFPLFLYSSCVARSNASTPPHLSSSLLISSDKYLRNISFVMKEVVYFIMYIT